MRLVVVGSSDAFNSAGRGHSSFWVEGLAREPFQVDFGGTALMGLNRLGLDPGRLGTILITHLHGDHFGGLPFLHVDQTFLRPRQRPLTLVGPRHLRERLEALLGVCYGPEITTRAPFELDVREIEPGASIEIDGARVSAHAADHLDPPEQALCLRIESPDGRVIAFSGDTAPCEGLAAAAQGADLLVAECTALEPPAGRHVTWRDWRDDLLPRLDARRVLLTHLGAAVRERLGSELPRRFGNGPLVELADDGAVVDLD